MQNNLLEPLTDSSVSGSYAWNKDSSMTRKLTEESVSGSYAWNKDSSMTGIIKKST